MNDDNNAELHELAHRYYLGELSYASYRNSRTQLLDRLTQQPGDASDSDDTKPMLDKTRLMPTAPSRWHPSVWLLMAVLIMIVAALFVWKSGWLTSSLVQMGPKVAIDYAYALEIDRR